jgi:hypothetical protein
MNGKSKCKILKDIRRQIAQDNDIEFVTSECKYQGDCSGTCPKCEAELRYLEQVLEKRQKAGKAIAVAGITAALIVGSTGCSPDNLFQTSVDGDLAPPETTIEQSETGIPGAIIVDPTENELGGEPVFPDPTFPDGVKGEIAIPDPTEKVFAGVPIIPEPTDDFIMGDIPLWP